MQKFFQQRQQMQIPQERPYVNVKIDDIDGKIEGFSKDYTIRKKGEVTAFISQHPEIITYIEKITPIINNYFPNNGKCLTFSKDHEFEELNEITIYIKSTESTFYNDWKKYDELRTDIRKMNGYPRKTKNLVSIGMWSL